MMYQLFILNQMESIISSTRNPHIQREMEYKIENNVLTIAIDRSYYIPLSEYYSNMSIKVIHTQYLYIIYNVIQDAVQCLYEISTALRIYQKRGLIHSNVDIYSIFHSLDNNYTILPLFYHPKTSYYSTKNLTLHSPFYSVQLFQQHPQIDMHIDMFSLGVTMYYCLTHNLPYYSNNINNYKSNRIVNKIFVYKPLDDVINSLISNQNVLLPNNILTTSLMQTFINLSENKELPEILPNI